MQCDLANTNTVTKASHAQASGPTDLENGMKIRTEAEIMKSITGNVKLNSVFSTTCVPLTTFQPTETAGSCSPLSSTLQMAFRNIQGKAEIPHPESPQPGGLLHHKWLRHTGRLCITDPR